MEESGSGRRCTTTGIFCGRTGLLVLMTGYALLGALLFKALEGGDEGDVPVHVQRSREDCLRELWLITDNCLWVVRFLNADIFTNRIGRFLVKTTLMIHLVSLACHVYYFIRIFNLNLLIGYIPIFNWTIYMLKWIFSVCSMLFQLKQRRST